MDYEKNSSENTAVRAIMRMIEDGEISPEVAKKYYPELAESEDERIRKSITAFFKNYSENGTWKAIPNVTKWIAWLEKQGEQKPVMIQWQGNNLKAL